MSALPTRPLGRTGFDVTILSLGGVTYNLLDDAAAAAVVHRALDLGINYIDTAHVYKESERKIGPVLAERRDEVFIATKSTARDAATMTEQIEASFQRLQTDRIDLMQIHDLHTDQQIDEITGPGGALEAIEAFRRNGSIRFVGVTGHRYLRPWKHTTSTPSSPRWAPSTPRFAPSTRRSTRSPRARAWESWG